MKISKRRYAELIRFYKSTIANPKLTMRVRLSAAQRLDDIYSRHEWAEQLALRRKDRIEAAAEAQRLQESGIPPQESAAQRQAQEDAREVEEVQAVFGRLLNRGGKPDAVAD